ncbi:efflux transporter outer membrane subunit [Vitreoscilla massiliensis]|uniref:Efflux transporter outer membrane subunit n=1 Tax=Vitreoscilla massiliensis TaxID=1689272 RepID=A0ABY4E532_9NEIS|nr:efflux transporter outer membrane subunit [Vitreoscilla massiliensis]UOO90864.1 efflux transporter outer membrane subunit [Vitreoscilla massiliensis]
MRRVLAAVAAVSLSACVPKLPPQPADAALNPPAQWLQAASNSHADLGVTLAEPQVWWAQLGDAQLNQYLELALRYNSDVNIAAARVQAALAQEAINRSVLMPSLSVGGSGSTGRSVNAFGVPTESASAQPVFQASYEVDVFGKNRHAWQAKKWQTAAAEAQQGATRLSVSTAVVRLYVQLAALQAQKQLLQNTLHARAQALKIAQDKARVGYSSQLELNQAQAEYAATQQQIPVNQKAIAQSQHALSTLIGTVPQALPTATSLQALRLPAVPVSMPATVLNQRPDIAAAAYALAATDEQLKSSRAQFLPTLQLSANSGVLLSSALHIDPVSIWSLGGSVLAPLFQGGRLTAQFEQATSARDEAAWQYRASVLKALQEVEDQLVAEQALRAQLAALHEQVRAVSSALQHANNRYHAGYAPYLEVLDAQRALYQLQVQEIQVNSEVLLSQVALYQALGGGWTGSKNVN